MKRSRRRELKRMSSSLAAPAMSGPTPARLCARAGYTPVVFDNLSTGHESFVRWGPSDHGDISDHATCARRCSSYDIAAVLHFAACAYVGESVINPQKYYDNNVAGSLSLLRAMLEAGMSEASCSPAPAPSTASRSRFPFAKRRRKQPVNPYGASKLMVERMLSDYARAYGLNPLRSDISTPPAPIPEGEVGELRDPETHLIPRAMMAIQGYLSDFAVFGSDYPTPDGTAIRDYIHVSDLADAHVAALRRLLDGRPGGPSISAPVVATQSRRCSTPSRPRPAKA